MVGQRCACDVEMTARGKPGKPKAGFPSFPPSLEIASRFPHSHIFDDCHTLKCPRSGLLPMSPTIQGTPLQHVIRRLGVEWPRGRNVPSFWLFRGQRKSGVGEKGWVGLMGVEKEGTPLLHVIRCLQVGWMGGRNVPSFWLFRGQRKSGAWVRRGELG